MTQASIPTVQPWWKYGHVWLVLAGPAIVVVAGITTAWIAMRAPDPVIDADYYRRGIEINKTLESTATPEAARSLSPALAARNHAATPTPDLPQERTARKP
jgi:hypothetical protein